MPSLLKGAVTALLFVSFPVGAQSTDTPDLLPGESVIRVQSTGEVERNPDFLKLNFSLRSEARSPKEAADENNGKLAMLVRSLGTVGVSESRISAARMTAGPVYEEGNGRLERKIIGYRAYQTVKVEMRDLSRFQAILDRIVGVVDGEITAEFDLTDRRGPQADAQRAAIANARGEAENIAGALGKRVGRLLLISNSPDGYRGWQNLGDHVVVSGSRAIPLTLKPAPVTVTSRVYVDWSLIDR